jgi:membrane-associated phospholipid phosphatase
MLVSFPSSPVDSQQPNSFFEKSFSWNEARFLPGELWQDTMTLPLEAALIFSLNTYYTQRPFAAWPFSKESANSFPSHTTFSRSYLLPFAVLGSSFVLGSIFLSHPGPEFSVGRQVRGWLHAVLLTELSTSFAKTLFQRKRPFYDFALSHEGRVVADDRFSFFSGHASHVFSFATYSSALMLRFCSYPSVSWAYSAVIFSFATWVAASRVTDRAHYVSDVLFGGAVGTLVSSAVFYRVQDVERLQKSKSGYNLKLIPYVFQDELSMTWYTTNLEFTF